MEYNVKRESAFEIILDTLNSQCETLYKIACHFFDLPKIKGDKININNDKETVFIALVYEGAFALLCEDYLKAIANVYKNDDYEYCMERLFSELFFSEKKEDNDYFIQQAKVLCEEHDIEFDINHYQRDLDELLFEYKQVINKKALAFFKRDTDRILKFLSLIFDFSEPGSVPYGNEIYYKLSEFVDCHYH